MRIIRIATNKISDFFCHSRGGGNPVALVIFISLVMLSGTVLSANTVFAVFCPDASTGNVIEVDANECPDNITNDAYDTGGDGGTGTITSIGGLLNRLNAVLNSVVPFLVGLGVFVIIYGIFGYIRHAADEEKRTEARMFMVWGVMAVFIMVSIWGLVNILINTLPTKKTPVTVPSVFPEFSE